MKLLICAGLASDTSGPRAGKSLRNPKLALTAGAGHTRDMTIDLQPAIRVVMMPRDLNPMGTIFGGMILSYIDQAGAVEVRKHTEKKVATVAMHEVKFIAPVFVGDLVSLYTELVKIGNTSITVRVTVDAARGLAPHQTVRVTQAEVVYVAVNEQGQPVAVRS